MLIRRYLLSGLLVWIPILVTIFVLQFLLGLLDRSIGLLPKAYQPETLLGFSIPGLGVVVSLAILLLTGLMVTNYVGHRIVAAWDSLVGRIPLVRTIYTSVKQTLHTMFSANGMAFRKVLLVEYPKQGLWSIAFQTGSSTQQMNTKAGDELVALFIPTTPNPTSGFLIMAPKKSVVELDLSVDEALKMVISLGVVQPTHDTP